MAAKQPVVPARVIGTRMAAAGKGNDTDSTSEPVRKKDMRWQRTERRIMQVFGNQLDQRPLNKISVTQLASEAEINKATFYLHYADIYELAIAYARASADEVVDGIEHPGAFFSDPELFAREFVAALDGEERFKKGRAFVDNGLSSVFADRLAARIYEVLRGQESPESPEQSQMFLVFLVHGLMGLLPRYLEEGADQVAQMAALVIEAMRVEIVQCSFDDILDSANARSGEIHT